MSTQPLITDQMRKMLQAQAAIPVPPPVPVNMAQPMQPLPVPAAPQVANVPNATDLTSRRLLTDQNELRRLQTSGSGIDQITKPVDASGNPTGAPVSGLRRFGDVLARIGDTAATLALGRGAAVIPGTTQRHYADINRQEGYVNNDLANQKEQAQTQQEQALTDFTLQRPDIEQSRIDQRQTAVQDRVAQAAAAKGQKVTWDSNGIPTFEDDHESEQFKDNQALAAMHQSTAAKNKVLAENADHKYIPGTPQYEEWYKKLQLAEQTRQIAYRALALRAENTDLRRQTVAGQLYGTDPQGNPLPGAAQIENDNGGLTTVGQKNAASAIKQNSKVVTFKDLAGSISQAEDSLKGVDLSDPNIVAVMQDPTSTIGKIIGGKLVQGTLSPQQANAISSIRQLHEQAGILRATTGGTAAEAQAQRILDTLPVAGDSPAMAASKLAAIKQVMGRLTPGVTRVAGGATPPAGTHAGGGTQAFTDGGVTYHIPAGQVAEFKKDHPNAR